MNTVNTIVAGWGLFLVCSGAGAQDGCVSEGQRLIAQPASPLALFGVSVAMEGDLIAVGASDDSTGLPYAGAIYLFRRQGSVWTPSGRVVSSDLDEGDFVGYAIALQGDTLVSGAWGESSQGVLAGAAYVFEKDLNGEEAWGTRSKLTAPDGQSSDLFGYAVAIDGDTVAVGAPLENSGGVEDRGAVYLFRQAFPGGVWTFHKKIVAPDPGVDAQFGASVAMEGGLLAVGAIGGDAQGENSGSAYLFARDQGGLDNWGMVRQLTGSDVDDRDQFGEAVAIDGDRLLVSASKRNRDGVFSGAVYVYEQHAGGPDQWAEVATFRPFAPENAQQFGDSVALVGDVAVVGASYTERGETTNVGAAYVFVRDAATGDWDQIAEAQPDDLSEGALFGSAVAVTLTPAGTSMVVGARGDAAPVPFTGSARVMDIDPSCTPACPVDLDGNGMVNFFDVSVFLEFFNAQDPGADFAPPSGVWNFFDVAAFLAAYGAGCP